MRLGIVYGSVEGGRFCIQIVGGEEFVGMMGFLSWSCSERFCFVFPRWIIAARHHASI